MADEALLARIETFEAAVAEFRAQDTWRQRLPVSTSALCLVAGYLLGPQGFGTIQIGLPNDTGIVEKGKS